MAEEANITKSLQKLEEIADWFDQQDEVDVEEGLTKVKEAAKLIKESKARLANIENEFNAIEKEISDGSEETQEEPVRRTVVEKEVSHSERVTVQDVGDEPINLDDIPF